MIVGKQRTRRMKQSSILSWNFGIQLVKNKIFGNCSCDPGTAIPGYYKAGYYMFLAFIAAISANKQLVLF